VSEALTNALLHAGTDVELRCLVDGDWLRVDVRDGSTVLPGLRDYGEEAMTGRGLALVETVADRWGVDADEDGKTVWFELGPPPAQMTSTGVPTPPPTTPDRVVVRLLALPAALLRVTVEQGDALLRELALMAIDDPEHGAPPWHASSFDLSPILAPLEAAFHSAAVLDLDVSLPSGAPAAALDRLARIEEADRMASEGLLLSTPALPEIQACRRWLYREIAVQAESGEPSPWRLPAPADPVVRPAVPSARQRAELDASLVAVIVADDGNRIVYVNDAITAVIGWQPAELVGRRLTTIVPPELREAHLVGFTRYALTGEARLLGRPVDVPALTRDDGIVDVRLTIEVMASPAGRQLFRASMEPT
jgi:PAS domain S-box-containing protein